MFVRIKPSGTRKYLQIVENYREGKKVRQRVIVTLGRAEQLIDSGQTDALAKSLVRFCSQVKLVEGHRNGTLQAHSNLKIGPSLIFKRLWSKLNIDDILQEELSERKFEYSVERAIFLTVLHRLFSPGSDRAAEKWKRDYKIEDADNLELHHLYRAMVWLGENYRNLEEKLFQRSRDLFSSLDLVFFDTTSIYFEGEGGNLGKRGHSKDHRLDLNQMIVGAVIDKTGRPVCCEMRPGNHHLMAFIATNRNLIRKFRHTFEHRRYFQDKYVRR